MALSNKNKGFCPLIDYGPPTGEVWVARKPAKIHWHIEEIGTGAEGLAKLRAIQKAQDDKNWTAEQTRMQNATIAFQQGEGHLLDDLKANKIEAIYHPGNDLTQPDVTKKTIFEHLKAAIQALWDAANLSD